MAFVPDPPQKGGLVEIGLSDLSLRSSVGNLLTFLGVLYSRILPKVNLKFP